MNRNTLEWKIQKGAETALIDWHSPSDFAYRPQFVSNNYREGRKVLSSVEDELLHCDCFMISVAFITLGGIEPLLQTLKELEQRGIPGEILTTDYLTFSEPKALKKLADFRNIELRMYRTGRESSAEEAGGEGFHTKGYIFSRENAYRIIIGSSNMTMSALTVNHEWNTKFISTEQGQLAKEVLSEFDHLWFSDRTCSFDEFIDEYETAYEIARQQRRIAAKAKTAALEAYKLKPNAMQARFVHNLKSLMEEGAERALLVSATGTGKTYAAAFGARDAIRPERMLFIVHREQIAIQAMESFRQVLGETGTYGLLSGHSKDYEVTYLFATMNMMAKDEILQRFAPDAFDLIIIDETHRAGAGSYQKIMSYFNPGFWLGMTASPERMDDFDIFKLFDHNIACEIRLQQALEEDLLCPFHYFGITEFIPDANGEADENDFRSFSRLVADERVDFILRQVEYYGHSGSRVKGLIFCSRKKEARELSEKFNIRGYHTIALDGEDDPEKRLQCVDRLIGDDPDDYLDYIFTVDIFNEGVDIPEINQVIFLRPTQSPIVFVQQLGRGLRKAKDKEFVVILDFIGNYDNNYMIPIALSGDRSYNKDSMRRYVSEGNRIIPGCSSIHFDEIARSRIYASIDTARTNTTALLKKEYTNLKYEVGHIPTMIEFEEHGSIDVAKYIERFGSYYSFLVKYEPAYTVRLSDREAAAIEFISRKLTPGKRIHELRILKHLIEQQERLAVYQEKIEALSVDHVSKDPEVLSAVRNLSLEFQKEADRKKYEGCPILTRNDNGFYALSAAFASCLSNPAFRDMVHELVEYGLRNYERSYAVQYRGLNFALYQKYTYEDVCLLLNWKNNMNAQNIGGYFYDRETATLPVFINYDKAEDAIAYEDRFVTQDHLIALSKHPRKATSSDADHIFRRTPEDQKNRILLFIRKNKDDKEAKEFYFLGEMHAEGEPRQIHMDTTGDDAFEINYRLLDPVKEELYEYITKDA